MCSISSLLDYFKLPFAKEFNIIETPKAKTVLQNISKDIMQSGSSIQEFRSCLGENDFEYKNNMIVIEEIRNVLERRGWNTEIVEHEYENPASQKCRKVYLNVNNKKKDEFVKIKNLNNF